MLSYCCPKLTWVRGRTAWYRRRLGAGPGTVCHQTHGRAPEAAPAAPHSSWTPVGEPAKSTAQMNLPTWIRVIFRAQRYPCRCVCMSCHPPGSDRCFASGDAGIAAQQQRSPALWPTLLASDPLTCGCHKGGLWNGGSIVPGCASGGSSGIAPAAAPPVPLGPASFPG